MAQDDEAAEAEIILVGGFTIGEVLSQIVGLQLIEFAPDQPEVRSAVFGLTPHQAEDLAKHLYLTAQRIREAGGPPKTN